MKNFILIFASLILAFNAKAEGKTTDMVVATVNKQAITLQELKNRITLSKLLINKNLSSAEFNILKDQAIEQLINEELIRQYADSKKIAISANELKKAITFIEKQRKLEAGSLFNDIPEELRSSATEQIKNSIYEKEIVQQIIVPRVFIPEYEINNLVNNILKQSHSKEYLISQLTINNSENQQQDMKKIGKIYEKLVAGEKFTDLVVAFSDGANKLEGGQLGWFSLDELNFRLKNAVKRLAKNGFSKPVKGQNGWFIVKVDDIKITENIDTSETEEFKYITFSSSKIKRNDVRKIKNMAKNVNGYSDFKKFKKDVEEKFLIKISTTDKWQILNQINKTIKQSVLNTLPGNFGKIKQAENKSLNFVYVVDKQIRQSKQVQNIKARIKRNLQAQKAERKFKQLKEDLQKKAFIELR